MNRFVFVVFFLLLSAIGLSGCQSNHNSQITTPSELLSASSFDNMSQRLSMGVEYIDSLASETSGFTVYRYLGFQLFGRKGTLIVKTDNTRKIVRLDWYLDDSKDWIYSFHPLVFTNIKDRTFTNRLASPVDITEFILLQDSLIDLHGTPTSTIDTSIKLRIWKDDNVALLYDINDQKLRLTILSKNVSLDDNEYWKFSRPVTDSSLASLTLGISPEAASRYLKIQLDVSKKEIVSNDNYILESEYKSWGIPGKLLLQFSPDDKLILCQWSFYRDGWPFLETVQFFCLDDLQKFLGEFNAYPSTGTKKDPLEIAFYKVFNDRVYTLRRLVNNTLVLDILDSKTFPPPRYMKK